MKPARLSPERRERLVGHLQTLFARDVDEPLSAFRAREIADLVTALIGPTIYNAAGDDVRVHLQGKLDDLGGEVFLDDSG